MADFVSRQRNSFQLLTARYRNPLNFATRTEHDVQEHLLERLMVADRARIERHSLEALNADDLHNDRQTSVPHSSRSK